MSHRAGIADAPPRHIVHVITRMLQGGAEENTVSTCLYQAARGSRVTLVHGSGAHPSWGPRLAGRVRLVPVPSLAQAINPLRDVAAVGDLARLFARLRPDVVHTHQSKSGILGRLAAARARVPLIVHTVHIAPFVNVRGARRWIYLAAEKWCARHTHLFIPVSQGMRDAFSAAKIGVRRRFEVIHSGMPLARFVAASPPADWRRRIGGWDRPERPTLIVMLAAFEPRKRQRDLLTAIAPALRARPQLCLLLAGEGSERARCQSHADALGIAGQVRFLGHDSAPHELIALADVCLLTSEREGLPRSAVQYVAAGKPVVIARLPGIDEVIGHGLNGIITDPDDLGETVAATLRLVDDEALRARLAAGARATDVSRWREEAMGARIEAAYRRARSGLRPIAAIEFFGLPGSGKTTIARHVRSLLREERGDGVGFSGDIMGDDLGWWRRSLRRLRLVATVLPMHPGTAARAALRLASSRSSPRDALQSLWNYWSVLAMSVRHGHGGDGLLVLDQGMIQAEWSARVHGTGQIEPAGQATPTSVMPVAGGALDATLFVFVEVAMDAARARLAARPRRTSRMQRSDRIGQRVLWSRGDAIAADLAERIEARLESQSCPSRLMRVRNEPGADPAAIARAIVAQLKRVEAEH